MTEILQPDAPGLARAATLLRGGALVAFPTETVYGLGADALNGEAVARVFEAKGRPRFNPLIVHLPDIEAARAIASFDPASERLAAAFWPGPLTLVLPIKGTAGLSDLVTAGLETVALRVPEHPVAQGLLRAAGRPLAAPSANISGKVSPTTAHHVLDGLNGRLAAVIDGGSCAVGVESTIVAAGRQAVILRPGGVPAEAIAACLGQPIADAPDPQRPTAPGQLASHYAPRAMLRLNATEARPGERLLGFGPVPGYRTLSETGDLVEAAANLFHHLRLMDAEADSPIAVAPIPEHGLGRAINDRLRRAAAPRH